MRGGTAAGCPVTSVEALRLDPAMASAYELLRGGGGGMSLPAELLCEFRGGKAGGRPVSLNKGDFDFDRSIDKLDCSVVRRSQLGFVFAGGLDVDDSAAGAGRS